MSKTIEELAVQYVKDVYNGDTDFIDEADCVLSWLFSKHLADRLTAEEKYLVLKEYADTFPNDPDQSLANIRVMHTLEHIFGKDFFKEDDHD